MEEEWMKYKAGYEISTLGNIYNSNTGKLKKASRSSNGYMIFGLFDKGKRTNVLVHRAVAEAFLGEISNGFEINHKDGNKTNNVISNLEIVTKSENSKHAIKMGLSKVPTERARGDKHWTKIHPHLVAKGDANGARLHPEKILRGDKCPASRLSSWDVCQIRIKRSEGASEKELAKIYGVTRENINSIVKRRSWKHL